MFNVYPCELTYTRTSRAGVLAGIPCPCTIGVPSRAAAERIFNDLVQNNPDVSYSDFNVNEKK